MLDRIQERGVKGLARYAVLVFPLLALVCGLGSSLWSPSAVSAQEPEVWLVRGDGYQVLEGLDLVSINAGRGHSCGLRADGVCGLLGLERLRAKQMRRRAGSLKSARARDTAAECVPTAPWSVGAHTCSATCKCRASQSPSARRVNISRR